MADPNVPVPVGTAQEMPAAAFTHTVRGFFGEELTIVAYAPVDAEDGGAVEFLIRAGRGSTERTASAHVSSPSEREAFMRALMEAYRIADGEKPATETRTEEEAWLAETSECAACGAPLVRDPDLIGSWLAKNGVTPRGVCLASDVKPYGHHKPKEGSRA